VKRWAGTRKCKSVKALRSTWLFRKIYSRSLHDAKWQWIRVKQQQCPMWWFIPPNTKRYSLVKKVWFQIYNSFEPNQTNPFLIKTSRSQDIQTDVLNIEIYMAQVISRAVQVSQHSSQDEYNLTVCLQYLCKILSKGVVFPMCS